jgi:transposase
VFEFQMGRGRAGPKRFLEGFEGLLQTDGYVAYEKVGGLKMVHVACWAHSRRALYEAHELAPSEMVAKEIVERIDDLFAIDRLARENGYDFAARHRLRVEHAPKLLSTIQEKLEAAQQQALPASKLGQAVAYALGLWPRLTIFLQYPEVELSNNLAENSMRGVAIGRKNWIHIGSPAAGPRVAAILSVTESCRRRGIPIREYLAAVLPGLADVRIQKLADLTPAAWAARTR